MPSSMLDLAPVPLSIFRSNSKFDENPKHSSVKYTRPITTIFCTRHDSDTIVVIGRIYLKLERSEFSSNFEFDRNMFSGTDAWSVKVIFIETIVSSFTQLSRIFISPNLSFGLVTICMDVHHWCSSQVAVRTIVLLTEVFELWKHF